MQQDTRTHSWNRIWHCSRLGRNFTSERKLQASLWGEFLPQVQEGIQLSCHNSSPGHLARVMLLQKGFIHATSRASDNLLATVATGPQQGQWDPGWQG